MHTLSLQIRDIVGENVNLCYQCEKCTSGCPVSLEMELVPAQIMHAAQLNLKQKILSANSIWLCASCETCTTRCPQGIDISKVMDALRIIARREKVKARIPSVPRFYNLCLLSLRLVGCIYEMGVAGFLRMRSGTLIKDMPLAKEFISKGKIRFLPKFRNVKKINRIISRVKKYESV
ncbi:MAG: 4Fe-4S dicluster domain-containing protein [candidate division KSB1 bacterium]|nr:4Fe-4S dicluster domain-containing protein [candidate division KSB1 bacterium]MDZ7312661.1 4Fe-4S dicluster domain-containing protein [candidate division KSB1 bacterium]